MGSLWDRCGVILGSVWNQCGVALGSCRKHSEFVLEWAVVWHNEVMQSPFAARALQIDEASDAASDDSDTLRRRLQHTLMRDSTAPQGYGDPSPGQLQNNFDTNNNNDNNFASYCIVSYRIVS